MSKSPLITNNPGILLIRIKTRVKCLITTFNYIRVKYKGRYETEVEGTKKRESQWVKAPAANKFEP